MKIVSYNILADTYIRPEWYPDVPSDVLDWSFRKDLLIQQLMRFKAEIICLQEVESAAFDEIFETLKGEGYQGVYARKGFGRLDGCATFFKKNTFSFQGGKTVIYNDHGENGIASGHVALILKLRLGNQVFGIVNTHIRWNLPEKLPAEHRGYRQVKELVDVHLSDDMIWVVCGDFNAEDNTPIMQLMTQAGLKDVYAKRKQPTMNKDGLVRIDYIFHSKEIELQPLPIFSLTEKIVLPSIEFPSDHLAIAATFNEM